MYNTIIFFYIGGAVAYILTSLSQLTRGGFWERDLIKEKDSITTIIMMFALLWYEVLLWPYFASKDIFPKSNTSK